MAPSEKNLLIILLIKTSEITPSLENIPSDGYLSRVGLDRFRDLQTC